MKILQILCHPDYNNEKRVANYLAKVGLEEIISLNYEIARKNESNDTKLKQYDEIEILNLYDPNCHIPQMDKNMFNYKEELNEGEKRDKFRQKELLKQWQEAEVVFIYMPLHNFNIVSKFKDYIDNIVIVNETFKCEIETIVGLDNPNKKVSFILTSGGEFDSHIQYANLDFAVEYMRAILSTIGISKMRLLRVQGLDLAHNNKENIIAKAKIDVKNLVREQLGKI